mgnify:CR=1 FL=1
MQNCLRALINTKISFRTYARKIYRTVSKLSYSDIFTLFHFDAFFFFLYNFWLNKFHSSSVSFLPRLSKWAAKWRVFCEGESHRTETRTGKFKKEASDIHIVLLLTTILNPLVRSFYQLYLIKESFSGVVISLKSSIHVTTLLFMWKVLHDQFQIDHTWH